MLKKLLLLILLTLTTYAENIKIPEEICLKHFDKVIEHGWSDENATLNAFIIKSGTRSIPKILTNLKMPLIYIDDPKIPDFPIAKLLVNRGQYKLLFAYIKYLEQNNHMEEVTKIYINTLQGLTNITPTDNLSLTFRMGIESIVNKSIKESQKRYGLDYVLKTKLKKSLLTDNNFLLKIVEKEKTFFTSILKSFPEIEKKNQELYSYLISSIENNSLNKYESYKKEKREEMRTFGNVIKFTFLRGKEKLYRLLDIEPDTLEIDKFTMLHDMYESRPRILETYQDYLTQVKSNKIFLKNLKENKNVQ